MENIKTNFIQNHEKYEVKKIKGTGKKKKTIYSDLFPEPSLRIALIAPTTGGKSTVIYHLLKYITSSKSRLIFVSSTINTDEVAKKIIEKFSKIIEVITFDDMNINTIKKVEEILKSTDDYPEEEDDELLYPKNVLVIDDVSRASLRSDYIYNLVKKIRHYGSLIISSQHFNDINANARAQLNYIMLFKGIGETKLKDIFDECIHNLRFDKFQDLYKTCISEPHGFLTVNLNTQQMRFKLNKLIS